MRIGDIHGCYQELLDLIEAAGLTKEDTVISVGRHGGEIPQSSTSSRPVRGAHAVMGNHELKNICWRRGELHPTLSQRITVAAHQPSAAEGSASQGARWTSSTAGCCHGMRMAGRLHFQRCDQLTDAYWPRRGCLSTAAWATPAILWLSMCWRRASENRSAVSGGRGADRSLKIRTLLTLY